MEQLKGCPSFANGKAAEVYPSFKSTTLGQNNGIQNWKKGISRDEESAQSKSETKLQSEQPFQ